MLDGKAVPGRASSCSTSRAPPRREPCPAAGGQGHDVTIATPSERIAAWCTWTLEGPRLRAQLHEAGVAMLSDVSAEALVPGAVRVRSAHGGDALDLAADAVVLVTQRLSNEALYLELAGDPAGLEAVYRTGDCVAPRWLVDTVFDGHRLAREIDSPDPAVYLRRARARRSVISAPAMSLTFVTGGARSGKSAHALRLAAAAGAPGDDDRHGRGAQRQMRARIDAGRRERPAAWRTVEEPLDLAAALSALPAGRLRGRRLPLAVGLDLLERSDGSTVEGLAAEAASLAARQRRVRRGLERGRHGNRPGQRAGALVSRRPRTRQRGRAEAAEDAVLVVSGRVLRLERA